MQMRAFLFLMLLSAVTLRAQSAETVPTLESDVWTSGLSASADGHLVFHVIVPQHTASLVVYTRGGGGNVDLRVTRGPGAPARVVCKTEVLGNLLRCEADRPSQGDYYITLHASAAFGGVSVQATVNPGQAYSPEAISLESGVPLPNRSGIYGSQTFYRIRVPWGTTNLEVKTFGGTGDPNMSVTRDQYPSTLSGFCVEKAVGTLGTCAIKNPTHLGHTPGQGADWFILVYGKAAYDGVTIVATTTAGTVASRQPENGTGAATGTGNGAGAGGYGAVTAKVATPHAVGGAAPSQQAKESPVGGSTKTDAQCDAIWRAILSGDPGWRQKNLKNGDKEYRWTLSVEGFFDVVWVRSDNERSEAATRYRILADRESPSGCAIDIAGPGVWKIESYVPGAELVLVQFSERRLLEKQR